MPAVHALRRRAPAGRDVFAICCYNCCFYANRGTLAWSTEKRDAARRHRQPLSRRPQEQDQGLGPPCARPPSQSQVGDRRPGRCVITRPAGGRVDLAQSLGRKEERGRERRRMADDPLLISELHHGVIISHFSSQLLRFLAADHLNSNRTCFCSLCDAAMPIPLN